MSAHRCDICGYEGADDDRLPFISFTDEKGKVEFCRPCAALNKETVNRQIDALVAASGGGAS